MLVEPLAPTKLAPYHPLTQRYLSGCTNAEPACAVEEPGRPGVQVERLRQEVDARVQTAAALL